MVMKLNRIVGWILAGLMISLSILPVTGKNDEACTSRVFSAGESGFLHSEEGLASISIGSQTLPQGGTVSICRNDAVWAPWEAKRPISVNFTLSINPRPTSSYVLSIYPDSSAPRGTNTDMFRYSSAGWVERMRARHFVADDSWYIVETAIGSFAVFTWYEMFIPEVENTTE